MENPRITDQYPTATVVNKQRHFLAMFFLSFMWGVLGVFILITGVSIIYMVNQFMQNDGIEKFLPGINSQIPGLDQFKNLNMGL